MVKKLAVGLLICILILSVLTFGSGYSQCSCEDEGFWSITSILECQKVSDFLIAVAYFSIPIELIYFISCSNVPFKWVLLEFIAFIVLCGMTHLLTGWTYYGPHAFRLVMSLTVLKFLTALVSCATAITLLTLIPLLLKVKVREVFLRKNVLELNQEVGMMKKKKEASWHVRMLTREIRKWLDKHTILDTTLVELSKTLDLQNCAVWMPNEKRSQMNLTHELKPCPSRNYPVSIQINDPDAREICESKGVRILRPGSALGMASSAGAVDPGSVAAIRMPLLTVSNFKGGTPELVETYYAILVLVLPTSRLWTYHELEIVEVVADQVAVALSHARILEESQLMMEKLGEQNRALQLAKKDAVMASQARDSFQRVMSQGMRRPMHSILGLLSMFQDETLQFEQRILVDSIIRTSNVLTTLINDVMDLSLKDNKIFSLEMKPFHLHSLVKEASCLAKSLFVYRGTRFVPDVEPSLPDQVIGDKRRTFQVLLHMVGYLTELTTGGGSVIFRVSTESGGEGRMGMWGTRYVNVKFEFELSVASRGGSGSSSRGLNKRGNKEVLSFSMCKKLVQMMQGNIWITQNIPGLPQRMTLLLRFQLHRYPGPTHETLSERMRSDPMFIGLRVILADDDPINRTVTKKLLEKLGCHVTAVSQGRECLATLGAGMSSVRVVLLDLHMPEMDGFEVARRIWKSRGGARVGPLIIAVTASAEENVWERCLEMGMNGLIRKPVVLQVLADELHRVLQRGQ